MVWFYQAELEYESYVYLLLSIPLWSDFIHRITQTAWQQKQRLSIPLWSDFIIKSLERTTLATSTFQSHYGLILSGFNGCFRWTNNWAFNPTMVWFYPEMGKVKNPYMNAFNPTMVWFYLKVRNGKVLATNIFQSHYGLILSFFEPVLNQRPKFLSIPLWSDFIEVLEPLLRTEWDLSIPLWSDFILQN